MRFRVPRMTLSAVLLLWPGVTVFAQTPAATRRLSVDDAVKLALEQNLGIQIERVIVPSSATRTNVFIAANLSIITSKNFL